MDSNSEKEACTEKAPDTEKRKAGTLVQFLRQNRPKITHKPNASKKPSSPKVLGEQYQPFAYLQIMNPKDARFFILVELSKSGNVISPDVHNKIDNLKALETD